MNYTPEQLSAAFDKVRNSIHWKDPIHKVIDFKDKEIVSVAISYFTATEAKFVDIGYGKLIVKADGYRRGPAGDH